MRSLYLAMPVLFVLGCSDSTSTQTTAKTEVTATADAPVASPSVVEKIERVDLKDDKAIVAAAGVPVTEVSESTDSQGAPKKIYMFGKGLNTQVELSDNEIIVGWDFADLSKEPQYKEDNLKNLQIARRLAVALLGEEGGRAVDGAVNGQAIKDGVIDGHKVWVTPCEYSVCLIKIQRKLSI